MNTITGLWTVSILSVCLVSGAAAQQSDSSRATVRLKDGSVLKGKVADESIRFQSSMGSVDLKVSDISSIEFAGGEAASSGAARPSSVPAIPQAGSKPARRVSGAPVSTKRFGPMPGLPPMAAYTAHDDSFSLYYPEGWTVNVSANAISLRQSPDDPGSAGMNIMPLSFQGAAYTSEGVIRLMAEQVAKIKPTLKVYNPKNLSQRPDMKAVQFSYDNEGVLIKGVAIAVAQGDQGMWVDIYGEESRLDFDPALLLSYVTQSISASGAPKQPAFRQTPPQQASGGDTRRPATGSMLGAHMWNMTPYMFPNAFSTYIPRLY